MIKFKVYHISIELLLYFHEFRAFSNNLNFIKHILFSSVMFLLGILQNVVLCLRSELNFIPHM